MLALDRYSRPSGAIAVRVLPSIDAAQEAASAAEKLPGMGETTSLIAQKLVAHAAPIVQNDHELQKRVGQSIGEGVGRSIAVPVYVASGIVAAAGLAVLWKTLG